MNYTASMVGSAFSLEKWNEQLRYYVYIDVEIKGTIAEGCAACFDVKDKAALASGEKGVGWCWTATAANKWEFKKAYGMAGTVEATAAKKFKAAADNGYETNW